MAPPAEVLAVRGLSKTFPGVRALDDVDLTLHPGEVHALIGENGAGKSTLIKLLTGVHRPDAGDIVFQGRDVSFATPLEAQKAGISTIYQEVNLIPLLSVARNLFLGREPRTRFGLLDFARMHKEAEETLRAYGVRVDVRLPLRALGVGAQQMVALARAVATEARVVIMDEPTSSLEPREVETLFSVIRRLRDDGIAVVYVSHRLDELYAVRHGHVLRDGRRVHHGRLADLGRLSLVSTRPSDRVRGLRGTGTGEAMTATKTDAPVTAAGGGRPKDTGPEGAARKERLSGLVQQHGALAVLVIVSLVASFSFDSFATGDNVGNMATSSAFLAIVALGMTFVIITGGIDLSVGSLFALGGVLAAWGSRHGTPVALLLPLVVCGGIGVVNGLLVARSRLAPFIVTLAAMLGARGLMLALTDEGAETYLIGKGSFLAELGQGTTLGIGNPVWITLALFAAGAVVLRRTASGSMCTRSAATRTRRP
ncbi:Vitamin B12 import ATP-binding protein BtuD [Streptomyces hirsutus]